MDATHGGAYSDSTPPGRRALGRFTIGQSHPSALTSRTANSPTPAAPSDLGYRCIIM
jgi:hypothetical protein